MNLKQMPKIKKNNINIFQESVLFKNFMKDQFIIKFLVSRKTMLTFIIFFLVTGRNSSHAFLEWPDAFFRTIS